MAMTVRNGKDRLFACREALGEIRRHHKLLDQLRAVDGRAGTAGTILDVEEGLREARLAYTRALSDSVEALAGMPDAPRAVLWQAYVLGKSNTQIAEALHFARRSVVRLKKTGFEWLHEQAAG